MILYHGSKQIVELPKYGFGKEDNDYGRGFYCTESLELAKEWACPIAKDGFANIYDFDVSGLSILKLNSDQYHILNWLALLLNNRHIDLSQNKLVGIRGREYLIQNFTPDISGYDVIIGYRADDRYFAFAKDFVQNGISVRQLASAMKLGELGEQVVLMSEKAFRQIHFTGYEISDGSVYYKKRMEREDRANSSFNQMHTEGDLSDDDLFMRDIIRERVKNDDPRLR